MKNFIRYSLVILLGSMILFSCKLKTEDGDEIVDPLDGEIILSGIVLSDYTGNAVVNAVVRVYDDSLLANGTTDSDGEYSIQINILHDAEFTLIVSGNDFISDTTTVFGIVNETTSVPVIRLVPSTSGTVTFTGSVLNDLTGDVISGAIINAFNEYVSEDVLTDALGEFSLTMTIFEEGEYEIAVFKDGYRPDTTTTYALFDGVIEIPTFRLDPSQNIEEGTGEAASIYLSFLSTEFLGIKESGTVETATLVFEVQDSSGNPIDINHLVEVQLSITAGPGGGEYVYPPTAETNADGKVYFTVNTGTIAGILQVEALIDLGTRTIRSLPVFFTIYGGFPVLERFSVFPDKINYPYYGEQNQTIIFTALIGDQYTNPVRPGTAVYFRVSEGDGLIGTFSLSDDLGRATATYVTEGAPIHPLFGAGFFEVEASTVTQNSEIITTSTTRLLSGDPVITNITLPDNFNIANGGSQVFNFTVFDENGNPLSAGTSIGVAAEGGNLKVLFDGVTLEDYMFGGPQITEFSARLYDDDVTVDELKNAAVKISVSGPNGLISITITGTTN
ncbi:hypothetical protein ACFLTH_12480 [Bacteroidota bacterium]